jgi:hypothetical protein
MVLLPTGEVFVAHKDGFHLYRPDPRAHGTPREHWRPVLHALDDAPISSVATPIGLGSRVPHTLTGRRFTGLSQAVNQVGSQSAATNYPLVRITRANEDDPAQLDTYYARTFNYCTADGQLFMGLATGAGLNDPVQTTQFVLPPSIPAGRARLCVVVNGIASEESVEIYIVADAPQPQAAERPIQVVIIGEADGGWWVWGGSPEPTPPIALPARIREGLQQMQQGVATLQHYLRESVRSSSREDGLPPALLARSASSTTPSGRGGPGAGRAALLLGVGLIGALVLLAASLVMLLGGFPAGR